MPPLQQLRHDALFYGSDEQFAGALVPFIRDGLERDQKIAAAVTQQGIALLHDALGTDAASVTFIDREGWYQRPGTTIAGWLRILAAANAEGHRYVRLIGEVRFGSAGQFPVWTRYESALNHVFACAPAWIVCPYDTRALPEALLADVRRAHPSIRDPHRHDSDAYVPTDEFLRTVPEPMPPVEGAPSLQIPLSNVTAARYAVAECMATAGKAGWDRLNDLLLATTEIVANSMRHGRGHRELRLWITDRAVICEVTDEGDGPRDPLLGYRPPDPAASSGRGLWLVQQISDRLTIDTHHGKTRVRIAMEIAPSSNRAA